MLDERNWHPDVMATRVRRRRRRRSEHTTLKFFVSVAVVFAVGLAVAGGIGASWAIRAYNDAPPLNTCNPVDNGRSSVIFAADGSRIGFIQAPKIRQPVPAADLPDSLKSATVAIEDRNFYKHGGVDIEGIIRAGFEDVQAGEAKQGGSTITQQLVRNLCIQNPQDTIKRKLIEAHLANDYEDKYSKTSILTQYLNTAPYGTVGGETAVGAEAAAQTYFSKHARDLNLREAAMLAGLPQAPSLYNPILDPQAARDRRNEVLQAMADQGYISQDRAQQIGSGGLGLHPGDKYQSIKDPVLYDLVQKELIDRYGVNRMRFGGLKVYTSINPKLQADAQAAVDGCSVCYDGGGPAAALASIDPANGEIVAYGSTQSDPNDAQFNYALQAQRQPGSSFKAFTLSTAIKQGIDPASTYYDGTSPKTLEVPGGGTYTVNNSEGEGGGSFPLTEATWASVNVVYAQLYLDVGPENVTRMAHQMGITSELNSYPAEAIGGLTYGVTPLEMADAYATLASGGVHHDATAISKVILPGGEVDKTNTDGKRVLSEGEAFEVTSILEGVITQGTGAGYASTGCSAQAGKTGTTEGESDAWFVGYTPLYSTAVWVGHPESRDATGFGGPTAGPIWSNYMTNAVAGNCPDFIEGTPPDLSPFTSGRTTSSSSSYTTPDSSYAPPDTTDTAPAPDVNAPSAPGPSVPAPAPVAPAGPPPSVGQGGGVGIGN